MLAASSPQILAVKGENLIGWGKKIMGSIQAGKIVCIGANCHILENISDTGRYCLRKTISLL